MELQIMAIIQRIIGFVLLSNIFLSDFVNCANVNGLEKRVDQDSYIDALHKTHAEDSLNCECEILLFNSQTWVFSVNF